jgi:hypothetical protein
MMTDFVMTNLYLNTDKVTAEKCAKGYHTVQHGHSYQSTDCGMKLCQTVFPDSDIVKKLFCRRTEAEDTVTEIVTSASVDDSLEIRHRNMIELEEEDLIPYFQHTNDASNHCPFLTYPSIINCRTP